MLYSGKPASNTLTTVFTATQECMVSLFICGQGTDTVTVHFVPSGGTAGDANKVISGMSITAGQIVQITGVYFENGESVQVLAANGNTSFTADVMNL